MLNLCFCEVAGFSPLTRNYHMLHMFSCIFIKFSKVIFERLALDRRAVNDARHSKWLMLSEACADPNEQQSHENVGYVEN